MKYVIRTDLWSVKIDEFTVTFRTPKHEWVKPNKIDGKYPIRG